MPNAKTKAYASTRHFAMQRTSSQELAEIKKFTDHLKSHPDEARRLLVKAGIYTQAGKLTKAYGG